MRFSQLGWFFPALPINGLVQYNPQSKHTTFFIPPSRHNILPPRSTPPSYYNPVERTHDTCCQSIARIESIITAIRHPATMLHVTVKLRHKVYRAIRPSTAHIAPSALLSQSKDQTLQFSRPDNDPVA